jgi:hypothetical protein
MQETLGESGKSALGLHQNLEKNSAGEILPGAGILHLHLLSFPDDSRNIFQVDIPGTGRVVESAVAVLFDGDHGESA